MKKPTNNSHLTAIDRTSLSFPSRYLLENNLLGGDILDFGCGQGFDTNYLKDKGYNIIGYDIHYQPEYPKNKFDIIICNYVLNVLEANEQANVLMSVSELLKPNGKAYFAVRRDLQHEGFRIHYIHKQYTYQCNVILPYLSLFKNDNCEIYEYQHYSNIKNKSLSDCSFCNLSNDLELITETATSVAFLDKFPVNKGHTLVIPKRHISNYFDLSVHEQRALWLVVNRCKEILEKRYLTTDFNVGLNVGENAGQTIFHCHIHLIPRYQGDVENPRGGVRGVIPKKQNY